MLLNLVSTLSWEDQSSYNYLIEKHRTNIIEQGFEKYLRVFNLLHENIGNIIENLNESNKTGVNIIKELREACNYEIYRESMIDAIDNNTKNQHKEFKEWKPFDNNIGFFELYISYKHLKYNSKSKLPQNISDEMMYKLYNYNVGTVLEEIKNSKKEDTTYSLSGIADLMRNKKEKGEFINYREAYRWAEDNMTSNGKSFTWKQLETEYAKAKNTGRI